MGFEFGIHGKKGIFTVSDRPTKGPAVLGEMHVGFRERKVAEVLKITQ